LLLFVMAYICEPLQPHVRSEADLGAQRGLNSFLVVSIRLRLDICNFADKSCILRVYRGRLDIDARATIGGDSTAAMLNTRPEQQSSRFAEPPVT